jgi:hypothetical protein
MALVSTLRTLIPLVNLTNQVGVASFKDRLKAFETNNLSLIERLRIVDDFIAEADWFLDKVTSLHDALIESIEKETTEILLSDGEIAAEKLKRQGLPVPGGEGLVKDTLEQGKVVEAEIVSGVQNTLGVQVKALKVLIAEAKKIQLRLQGK